MLAGVAGQNVPTKTENLLNLVNNKIIEEHEHQKLQTKHQDIESQKNFMGKKFNM